MTREHVVDDPQRIRPGTSVHDLDQGPHSRNKEDGTSLFDL